MTIATGEQILAADVDGLITVGLHAGDTLRNSNDTQKTTASVTYVKKKEVKLNADLAKCRIKFDLSVGSTGYHAYGRVYKNGVAIGTEQSTPIPWDGGWWTVSEDFSGFVTNDLIQIYLRVESGFGGTAYVCNMRFYYDRCIETLKGETLLTPPIIDVDPTISMTNQDP